MTNKEIAKLKDTGLMFGNYLMDKGIAFCKNSLICKREAISAPLLRQVIDNKFGKTNFYSMYDKLYYRTDIEAWKLIMKKDLIDKQKYTADYMDCDNFAFWFASRASGIYGLNSCFVATGGCYKKDGTLVRHAFNVIVTRDNKIWVYEPQTDNFAELNNEGTWLTSPNWNYKISWMIVF